MSLQIFDGLYEEGEYVDLRTNQMVGGIKTFVDALVSLAGANAITIRRVSRRCGSSGCRTVASRSMATPGWLGRVPGVQPDALCLDL